MNSVLPNLVAGWASQGGDECAGARRIIEDLERGVEVEDVTGREAAAGAVNREHRVAIDFVEVDVFQHGAAPVREVEKVHAGLVGVDAGLDGDAAHGFAAAEEQVEVVAIARATFFDDLRDGDAEVFPGMLLLDGNVSDELGDVFDTERLQAILDVQAHV